MSLDGTLKVPVRSRSPYHRCKRNPLPLGNREGGFVYERNRPSRRDFEYDVGGVVWWYTTEGKGGTGDVQTKEGLGDSSLDSFFHPKHVRTN